MNITYVTSQYLPTEIAISLRGRFVVAELCRRGHSVTVLSSGSNRIGPSGEPVIGVAPESANHGTSLIKRLLAEIRLGLEISRKIWRQRHETDLLIITSPAFFMMLIVATAARWFQIPYVLDVRDRYPAILFSLGVLKKNGAIGRVLSHLERQAYRGAQMVIAVTKPICTDLFRECQIKAQCVMNGYDMEIFSPRANPREDGSTKVVIHGLFGQFFEEEIFIKMAKYCLDRNGSLCFYLIGYGEKLKVVRTAGLSNVEILGRMKQPELANFLKDMDIGAAVSPLDASTSKSFAVKIFEYIGAGLPVMVMANGAAANEITKNEMGVAFNPEDWRAAAEWMLELVAKPEYHAEMIQAVITHRTNYSRQRQSNIFANLIEETSVFTVQ